LTLVSTEKHQAHIISEDTTKVLRFTSFFQASKRPPLEEEGGAWTRLENPSCSKTDVTTEAADLVSDKKITSGLLSRTIALRLRIVEVLARPLQFQDRNFMVMEGAWINQPPQLLEKILNL
jgi:hypothetical protein